MLAAAAAACCLPLKPPLSTSPSRVINFLCVRYWCLGVPWTDFEVLSFLTVHACNPSTQEVEGKRYLLFPGWQELNSEFQVSLGYASSLCLKSNKHNLQMQSRRGKIRGTIRDDILFIFMSLVFLGQYGIIDQMCKRVVCLTPWSQTFQPSQMYSDWTRSLWAFTAVWETAENV